jgi:hypothetical protein
MPDARCLFPPMPSAFPLLFRMTDSGPHDSRADAARDSVLTWAALLGKWTEFAGSAVALPKTGELGRFRASVPDIIALQAVSHALGEVDSLPDDERAVALDRAAVLIRSHAAALHEHWRGEPLPAQLAELADDARMALYVAKESGYEWSVAIESFAAEHPANLVQTLLRAGFDGDLFLPSPGVKLFQDSPVAFARGRLGATLSDDMLDEIGVFLTSVDGAVDAPERMPVMRQVYRQFDFLKGGPVRDLVLPMNADLQGGQPLLIPVIERGVSMPVPLPSRREQPAQPLPVEFFGEDADDDAPGESPEKAGR